MFSVGKYFTTHQAAIERQMAHLVAETPTRLPASVILALLAGIFIEHWVLIGLACVYFVVDDIILYFYARKLNGPNALRSYMIILISNTFCVFLFSLPFGIMIYDPANYISHSIAILCLMGAYVQTATMRTMDSFHGLVTSLPLMVTLVIALFGLVITQDVSTYLMLGGLLSLALVAIYLFWMFINNAKLRYELEIEKERAFEANLAKTEFLGTMSHEIRTPLNGVMGAVQLLQESRELDGEHWKIDVLLRSVNNLKSIVDEAIDVSRVESGKLDLKVERTDLIDMMNEIRILFDPVAVKKGLALDLEIDPAFTGHHLVAGNRVRQIVINLTSNAIKYTESGSVKLRMSENDGQVAISVVDTGVGISVAEQDKLFDRFSRLTDERTLKTEGSGLGLAISKSIAQAIGGDISVVSEDGEGSCFTLSFPAQKTDAPEKDDPAVFDFDPSDIQGRNILIVDDNEINRTIVREFLKNAGANVVEMPDGQHALEWLDGNKTDLILLDQRMPVMDGPEMLRLLRNGGTKNAQTKVVVLTAGVSEEPHVAFEGLEVAAVLSKPILKEELLTAVSSNLVETQLH